MPTLRRLHLCLGCFFAPMLVFFTLSGLWQTYPDAFRSQTTLLLSSIHTGRSLKAGMLDTLSSPVLRAFVVLMAFSLLMNVGLGLALAFRSAQHRRLAAWSLIAGTAVPAAFVTFTVWQAAQAPVWH